MDYKCCVKNLLRFLNSNLARGRIEMNYLQGILFFGLLKIQIILKMKIRKGNLYLVCFFYLLISYSYSLHNLNRSGFLYNSSFKMITQSIKFHRYAPCTLHNFYFKNIPFKTQIGQNLRQDLTIQCYQFNIITQEYDNKKRSNIS